MKRFFTSAILGIVVIMSSTASVPKLRTQVVGSRHVDDRIAAIGSAYMDSLNGLTQRYKTWTYKGDDSLANPYYFPLFAAPTFYVGPVHREMGLLTMGVSRMQKQEPLVDYIDGTLCNVYADMPWLIRHNETDAATGGENVGFDKEFRPEVHLVEKTKATTVAVAADDDIADDWQITVRKPNFWSFSTTLSLQLMQSHISDNWYKGGDSYNSWLMKGTFVATYNNRSKVVFTNTLETKLGFISSQGDSVHSIRSNEDLLRLTNKLGLQATKNWYYTFTLQSSTQFYPGNKTNNTYVYSDFMSPFESVFSIGMDYKLTKKKLTFSATISPFAYDFKYVDRKYLATSYGIDEGKHADFGFGSTATINYTWTILNNVSWTGRIYYYTDYSNTKVEWENTFKLKINKILSAELFLYPRFDDSVSRDVGESYFQFREQLTFGLDVTF